MQKLKKILKNEEGQLLPFIAIIMILLILFTALQFGLSMAYLSRIKVRDALDSAVLSAVSLAERRTRPTYYGERRKVIRDSEGNIVKIVWVKTTKNNKEYLYLSHRDAKNIAEEYLLKNLKLSNLKDYKVLDLDIDLKEDVYMVQVTKKRPRTEGITATWEENYPRWVKAEASVKVEVPAPLGGILGREKVIVQLKANSRKHLLYIPLGGIWN